MVPNQNGAAATESPPVPARSFAARCESGFGKLVDALNGVGSLLIFAVMVLVGCDVIGRALFGTPIYGVAELVALSVVAIVFLQLGSALRHQRMTRADLFLESFMHRRPRAGLILSALFNLGGVGVCIAMALATGPVLVQAWSHGQYIGVEGLFKAETWPVRLIVIVGSSVAGIQYLLLAWADMRACARTATSSE